MSVIDFAKRFARAGFYVFPLYSTDAGPKKPFGWALNTVKEKVDEDKIIRATNSESEIDLWPQRVKEAYNSTIDSYGVLGKGIVIIDIDIKNGQGGDISYEKLRTDFNIPAATLVVKSRSGGIHLYFAKSKRFTDIHIKTVSSLKLGNHIYRGVDIRGDGGMVIGPTSEGEWQRGTYTIIRGEPGVELAVLPEALTAGLIKNTSFSDLEAMTSVPTESTVSDILAILKRGEIPPKLPLGQRNEGFYIFIHALKNRGLPRASVRALCESLKEVTEEIETLNESVDLDDMLNRAYAIDPNNPYDIARDTIDFGMYQLLAYSSKLQYIIPNPNPYITSKNTHDESSMKTLFARHAREMVVGEKRKVINPVEVIIKLLPDTHKVDTIGFKPGAPDVYSNSEDSHGKTYLNMYLPPFVPKTAEGLDLDIYKDFCLLVSRIFGSEGTEEYQLGLDFVAWHLQNPQNKCVISPYIMSKNRGVGKSAFFNILAKIFGTTKRGDKQAQMVKVDEITGRFFNPAGRLLNMMDEVQFPVHRDMRRESTTFWRHLKNLITAETVPVEFKGGDTYQMPNTAGYIMAGNTGSHFPIEEYDRRIWIIDNSPPILERGTIDRLMALSKSMLSLQEQKTLVHSLRYCLQNHKIELALDSIRAPMNELKREMMLNSMTNEDEWFYTHFENPENLLAATPVVSKSALLYVFENSDQLIKSRYAEDCEGLFRDFKRKGYIRPIRTPKNPGLSRQFSGVIPISPLGEPLSGHDKEYLYTTRDHGSMDNIESSKVIQYYIQNIHTIKAWKEANAKQRKVSNPAAPSIDVSSI